MKLTNGFRNGMAFVRFSAETEGERVLLKSIKLHTLDRVLRFTDGDMTFCWDEPPPRDEK